MFKALIIYLVILNIMTLLIYCLDRLTFSKENKHQKVYSLLVLVLIGGSIGAWFGTKLWPPKSMVNVFKYTIPTILLIQVLGILYLRYQG